MKTERLLAFILIDFLRDFLAFNMHIKVVKLNINWIGTLTHEKFKKKQQLGTGSDESKWKITLMCRYVLFYYFLLNTQKMDQIFISNNFCVQHGKKLYQFFSRMV